MEYGIPVLEAMALAHWIRVSAIGGSLDRFSMDMIARIGFWLLLVVIFGASQAFQSIPVSSSVHKSGRIVFAKNDHTRCQASLADVLVNTAFPIVLSTANAVQREIRTLTVIQKALFLFVTLLGFAVGRATPFWKRFSDAAEIPSTYFDQQRLLRGRAVRISDGDTIRFLHRPAFWSPKGLKKKERASKLALPIRFCTVDTPETAKFGKKGQPFAKEAKEAVRSLLDGRPVFIRLLKRDQYSRIVAQVYTRKWRFFKRFADEELLRQGLAEVYTGAGAVYGPKGKEAYVAMEQDAKSKKIGMWAQGSKRESAAEYKRRTK